MKTLKNLMALTLVMAPLASYASGDKVGGGGDIYACYEDFSCIKRTYELKWIYRELVNAQKVDKELCEVADLSNSDLIKYTALPKGKVARGYLKDVKEWNELNKKKIPKSGSLTLEQVFTRAYGLIEVFRPTQGNLYEILKVRLDQFEAGGLVFSEESVLPEINDSSEIIKLKKISGLNCFEKQLAVQQFEDVSGRVPMLRVDEEYYNSLDGSDKVALLLHEALYYAYSEVYETSDSVRLLVGMLMSGEFSAMKKIDQVAYLIKHGLFHSYEDRSGLVLRLIAQNNYPELFDLSVDGERKQFSNVNDPDALIVEALLNHDRGFIKGKFECKVSFPGRDFQTDQQCNLVIGHSMHTGKLEANYYLSASAKYEKTVDSKTKIQYAYDFSSKSLQTDLVYGDRVVPRGTVYGVTLSDLKSVLSNPTPVDPKKAMTFEELLRMASGRLDDIKTSLSSTCGDQSNFQVSLDEVYAFVETNVYPMNFMRLCKFEMLNGVAYPVNAKEPIYFRHSLMSRTEYLYISEKEDFSFNGDEKVALKFKILDFESGRYQVSITRKGKLLGMFDFTIKSYTGSSGYHIYSEIQHIHHQDRRLPVILDDRDGELKVGQTIYMSNLNWGNSLSIFRPRN